MVGNNIPFEELLNKHDSVFIGIGLGENANLVIPGENLTGVFDAVNFIREVKKENWSSVDIGKRVAVIGAGNTAIDVATAAVRLGAEEVTILYRRSKKEMPANDFEFELAKSDGVKFKFLTSPIEILGDSLVEGIQCVRMELGNKDKKGRRRSTKIPNSEFNVNVDMVVFALGQRFKSSFLQSIPGVKIIEGKIEVNPESFQTANLKVFAGGDCINGGKEVVNAAYDGKQAARGIDNYLSSVEN